VGLLFGYAAINRVEPSTKLAGTVYDENGDFFSNELSVTLDSNSVAVAGSRYDLSDV
jgi:hypothetical protein